MKALFLILIINSITITSQAMIPDEKVAKTESVQYLEKFTTPDKGIQYLGLVGNKKVIVFKLPSNKFYGQEVQVSHDSFCGHIPASEVLAKIWWYLLHTEYELSRKDSCTKDSEMATLS